MTSLRTRRRAALRTMAASMALGAFGLHASIGHAQAANFPDRPIRWIVPWPPGGGADMLARMLNVKLGQVLGQPVVIDNRGGAGGNIGASAGAKAAPDGYTMTFAYSATHSINPHVYPKMPFKESEFAPVIFISLVPQVLVVNASSPARNLQEWLALAKKREMAFASAGQGSIGHLGDELFASLTGINMLHVPYKGGGPALAAVLSGEVDALFGVPVVLAPQIKAGNLRAIGVTTVMRTSVLPDVPTIAEQGVPGFDVSSWNGVHVPAGTPPEVIAKLNAAFNKVLADPDVRKHLIDNGYEIIGGEPVKFSSFVADELKKWKPVVKKAKVQIE